MEKGASKFCLGSLEEGFAEMITCELNLDEFKGKWEVEGRKGTFGKTRVWVILSTPKHVPQANMVMGAGDPKMTLSLPPISFLAFVENGHSCTSVEKYAVNATW